MRRKLTMHLVNCTSSHTLYMFSSQLASWCFISNFDWIFRVICSMCISQVSETRREEKNNYFWRWIEQATDFSVLMSTLMNEINSCIDERAHTAHRHASHGINDATCVYCDFVWRVYSHCVKRNTCFQLKRR